jgi:phage terminase Nu1 subunit (DNA packaging protein)
MAKEKTISIREYADHLKVDEKAVRKAIDTGKIKAGVKMITKTIKGKKVQVPVIIKAIADKEYGQLKAVKKPQRGVSRARLAKQMEDEQKKKPAAKKAKPTETEPLPDPEVIADLEDMDYDQLLKKIKLNDTLPYAEIIRRKEILAAADTKMKLEKERGKLVEKTVVDKLLYEIGNRLKQNMQNIPSRVVPLVRSSPNDVDAQNILLTEINSVLEALPDSL